MKKFFSAFLTAILLVFPISLSACDSTSPNVSKEMESDGWVEVQNIVYLVSADKYQYTNEEYSLTSSYSLNLEREEITQEEYESASTAHFPYSRIDTIQVNRESQLNELSQCFGKIYYEQYATMENGSVVVKYEKIMCTGYELHYIRVKIFDDGSIGLNYYQDNDNTYISLRVLPTSYIITYFTE